MGRMYICRSGSGSLLDLVLISPCGFLVVPRASALPDPALACSEVQNHPGSGLPSSGLVAALRLGSQDSSGLRAALTSVDCAIHFLVLCAVLIKTDSWKHLQLCWKVPCVAWLSLVRDICRAKQPVLPLAQFLLWLLNHLGSPK